MVQETGRAEHHDKMLNKIKGIKMETYIIRNVKDKSMFIAELQKVNNYNNIRIKVLAVCDSDIKLTISRRFRHTYPINLPEKYKHLKIERIQ